MTRVWSMASERSDTQDCAQFEDAIIYVCVGQQSSSAPPAPPPPPLPPDNDSGYEASPSSATRLTSFQFGSVSEMPTDCTLDEELLSIDLFVAPVMLYENEDMDGQQDMTDEEEGFQDNDDGLRAESRNSSNGSSSGSSSGSDRLISTPIPIPTASRMTRSMHENSSQMSHLRSSLTERSNRSPLSLSQSNITFGVESNAVVRNYDERGFRRGAMFARHNWNRYHIGMAAISPQSPPSSTYWSPYILGIMSPTGQRSQHYYNHNHYFGFDESVTSAQSSLSYAQDIRLPSPLSSFSFSSQMSGRAAAASQTLNESHNSANNNQPLPDVVNVEPTRMRLANGHSHARRAVSVSLPIDVEIIRSVGMSLRRISEEFEISNSRMMLSNSEPGSQGMVGNIFVRLSRRSLSSRFRSRHINGRQRSFSTNDAPEE